MKFFATVLLAVCLFQGYNATPMLGALSSMASGVTGKLGSVASSVIDTAASMAPEQLKSAVSTLTPTELLETINGATSKLEEAQTELTEAVKTIESCSISEITKLGTSTAKETVACITDKVKEGYAIAKDLAQLVPRGLGVAKKAYDAYNSCEGYTSSIMLRACQTKNMGPVVYDSAMMVKDCTVSSAYATKYMYTLKSSITSCLKGVASEKSTVASGLAKCVGDKFSWSSSS